MSDKLKEQEDNKVKLTLRQHGDPTLDEELEYEVIDTSCARFACKEMFCREDAIKLCDDCDVTVVYIDEDQQIGGFGNV